MLHTFPLAGTRPRGKTDEEDKALEAELLSDEKEVRNALRAGARVIGVNNRNLKDFSVNTDNSRRLRELISRDVLLDSGTGTGTAFDWKLIQNIGRPYFLA